MAILGVTTFNALLYQAALQHLLDLIFVLLCDAREQRMTAVNANLERMQEILSP